MIVTDLGDRWRLITQPDHARFSGELLRLWRGPELAAHPRRDEILFAAREHDNGWREPDAAPRWNGPEGRPHHFTSVPPEVRIEVFLRGTARFAEEHPYASLLITLHALSFTRRGGEEEWDAFVARLEERRDQLLEETGAPPEQARADYRWVHWADAASLWACAAWSEPFEKEVPSEVPAELPPDDDRDADPLLRTLANRFDPERHELHVDPFPLAGATRFRIPCRTVEKRPYAGDADFATALATARWEELEVRVVPGR